jgi:hypothetical protein
MVAIKSSARVLAGVMVFSLLMLSTGQPVSGQPEAEARLTPLQGLVQRRADTDPEYMWQTITQEDFLYENDWVQTDHLGLAEVIFFDGNLVEVLPNSLFQVSEYTFVDDDSPVLTIDLSVGDLFHEIKQLLDEESRYEVHTPSAVVSVRGTKFFASVTWLGETIVNHDTGTLAISGVSPEGVLGLPTIITESLSLPVAPDGRLGAPGPYSPPIYPPSAPLAPETCGDAICQPGESSVCALDCQTSATCGNGICEAEALEGPVTCRVDCVPAWEPSESASEDVAPATTGQPCTVSTAASGVIVRVGPGFQRGSRMYLVPNVNVPVSGKFTDSAGNLWWNVQPPDYIPAEADRYWVLAADVTDAGDCTLVPETAAPPVVAPQQPQPSVPTPGPVSVPTRGPAPATSVPTQRAVSVSFYADRYTVNPRRQECATIFWAVEGIMEVYYQGRGVTGQGSSVECPLQTTTYTLTVTLLDGTTRQYNVTITVDFQTY